jgi:hypothetical protein
MKCCSPELGRCFSATHNFEKSRGWKGGHLVSRKTGDLNECLISKLIHTLLHRLGKAGVKIADRVIAV